MIAYILYQLIVCRQRVLGLWSLLLPSLLVVSAVVVLKMTIELVGVLHGPPLTNAGLYSTAIVDVWAFVFTAITYGMSCLRLWQSLRAGQPVARGM